MIFKKVNLLLINVRKNGFTKSSRCDNKEIQVSTTNCRDVSRRRLLSRPVAYLGCTGGQWSTHSDTLRGATRCVTLKNVKNNSLNKIVFSIKCPENKKFKYNFDIG